VEPDGYDATFQVSPPEGERRASSAACASSQPEDELFPPGVDSSAFLHASSDGAFWAQPTPAP